MSKFRNVTWNNARFPAYIQIRRSIDLAELGDFGSIVDTPQDLPTSGATNRTATSGSASGTRQYVDLGVIGGSTSNVVDTQDMDSIATTASTHRVWSNMGAVSDVPFTTSLIGSLAYAPTATQMVIDGDVTSSISAGDTISTEDGDNEVTVSLSAWPKDATSLASAASSNHGAGTVRVLNSDVRSSFPTGSIISANSDFSSNAEVTGTTYSSFNTNTTTWSAAGSKNYILNASLGNQAGSSGPSSWNAYQGPVIQSGQSVTLLQGRTLSQSSNGQYPVTTTSGTATRKVPSSGNIFSGWSSYSFEWRTTGAGHIRTTIEIKPRNNQQFGWQNIITTGKLLYVNNMSYDKGQYFEVTGVTFFSNTTSISVTPVFNVGYSRPANETGGTLYLTSATNATQVLISSSSTANANLGNWNRGTRATYYQGTTSTTTYYTQIDYSGTADLFNSGDTIYGGLDETEITLNSGGTAYSNGDNVYKKT